MIYLKKVISTMVFAVFSPLYLLYICCLIILAPIGLLLSSLFRTEEQDGQEYIDTYKESVKAAHSVKEATGITRLKHIVSNLFFALFSPLYLLYIFALISISPIILLVSKLNKLKTGVRHHASEFRRKIAHGNHV